MKANTLRLDPTSEQLHTLHLLGDRVSALWNAANYASRQAFLSGDKVPSYASLCRVFQGHEAYRAFPSDVAQEVLKKLREAWTSYFGLRKRWKAGNLRDKPGLPTYRKDRQRGTRPTDFIPIKNDRAYGVESRSVSVTLPRDLRDQGRLVLSYRGIRRYQGKGGRAEMQFDASRGRWYFRYSVQVLDTPSKPWTRVAGIDLGLRVMASLSIEGIANAWHFLGREAMKDFEYWSAKLATHQQALSHRGKRTSKRLKRFYRMRKNRLRHAVDTMAKRLASACRRHKVGHVLLGWPKGILLETRANPTWQRLRHVFWSFDYVSSRVELALRRVGIRVERVGERGTSSTFCTCGSKRVVRRPRHVLRCQDCQFKCHSDQAGSRNIVRQRYPETTWAGLEASPKPKTYRWTRHRWVDASNPAIYQVADLAA